MLPPPPPTAETKAIQPSRQNSTISALTNALSNRPPAGEFQAVILAGPGVPLHPLTLSIPKALLPVAGRPLLSHTLKWVWDCGIRDILIVGAKSSSEKLLGYVANLRRDFPNNLSNVANSSEFTSLSANISATRSQAYPSSDFRGPIEQKQNHSSQFSSGNIPGQDFGFGSDKYEIDITIVSDEFSSAEVITSVRSKLRPGRDIFITSVDAITPSDVARLLMDAFRTNGADAMVLAHPAGPPSRPKPQRTCVFSNGDDQQMARSKLLQQSLGLGAFIGSASGGTGLSKNNQGRSSNASSTIIGQTSSRGTGSSPGNPKRLPSADMLLGSAPLQHSGSTSTMYDRRGKNGLHSALLQSFASASAAASSTIARVVCFEPATAAVASGLPLPTALLRHHPQIRLQHVVDGHTYLIRREVMGVLCAEPILPKGESILFDLMSRLLYDPRIHGSIADVKMFECCHDGGHSGTDSQKNSSSSVIGSLLRGSSISSLGSVIETSPAILLGRRRRSLRKQQSNKVNDKLQTIKPLSNFDGSIHSTNIITSDHVISLNCNQPLTENFVKLSLSPNSVSFENQIHKHNNLISAKLPPSNSASLQAKINPTKLKDNMANATISDTAANSDDQAGASGSNSIPGSGEEAGDHMDEDHAQGRMRDPAPLVLVCTTSSVDFGTSVFPGGRASTLAAYVELNRWFVQRIPNSQRISSKATILGKIKLSDDCVIGEGTILGDKTTVKNSVLGAHCRIGSNVKIANSIIMDYAIVEEEARLESTIVCTSATVESNCSLRDCVVSANAKAHSGLMVRGDYIE